MTALPAVEGEAWCIRAGACALVLIGLGTGCAEEVHIDADETELTPPPVAEFDPGQSIVPLPNALLMDPATGRVNVPVGCGEEPGSGAERLRLTLNQLDGFGTSKLNVTATFSEPVDPASLDGRVLLLRLAERGQPIIPPEPPVAVEVVTSTSLRTAADCQSQSAVPSVVIRPLAPLQGSSTYGVLFAAGVQTESGEEVQPSATWALVRQAEPPVTFEPGAALPSHNATPFDPSEPEGLATLRGLDLLWRGHAPLLTGLGQLAPFVFPGLIDGRDDILLAWAFDTQTIADPLDGQLAGSPANWVESNAAPLDVPAPAAGGGSPVTVEQVYAQALPGVPCSSLGCAAIGAIYTAGPLSEAPTFTTSSYLTGDDCALAAAAAGAFDDPVAPTRTCDRSLPALLFVPSTPAPAAGYPAVIFAHGLGRSKEDLFAFAGGLASQGFVSVAFDALDHGGRAVQVSTDAAAGCDRTGPDRPCTDTFGPTCAPQCYAPLLSADLAMTRDHLRQTVLDQLALGRALAGCTGTACGGLVVDPERIGYVGQSLGALIGGVSVARSADVSAAVLNVGAADWLQILADTQTLAIRCPLVDALIASGVLAGEPWSLGENPNALCVSDTWKTDPGFLQFAAAARWILDPVDGVNHARVLQRSGGPAVLLGEVVGDTVIPNSATATYAGVLGLTPGFAAVATSATPTPTPAVATPGSHWVQYQGLPADPGAGFPGNAYAHGSLLAPAEPAATMVEPAGQLGTVMMQVDALTFLSTHVGGTP